MDKSRNRTTKRRKPGDKPADTEPEVVEELPDESTEAKNSKLRGGRCNGGRGGGGGAKRQRTDTASTSAPPSEDTVPSNPVPAPYPGPPPKTTPVIPLTVAPLQNASVVPPLAPLTPQFFDTMGMASASQRFVAPAGLSQSCTQPLWQPAAFPLPFNGPMPPYMSPHHLLG